MASALSIAGSAIKNFQIDQSILAGGAGAIATVAIGAVLVAMNVTVPFLGIPLTMTMVTSAALPIGHFISSVVPATKDQQIDALATRLGVAADHLKSYIPQIVDTFPNPCPQDTGTTTPSNINKG